MLRRLAGEEGVSYALPFVLLLPFCLFFVLTVFQVAFLLLAKLGTLHAAHAGARSAAVWQSAQPAALRAPRVRQAVFTALAPFAGGNSGDAATAGAPPGEATAGAQEFAEAYTGYTRGAPAPRQIPLAGLPAGPSPDGLQSKYLCAAARTTVGIDFGKQNRGDVTVTVTYRVPLLIPVVARWLSQGGNGPYEYQITSAATLPGEAPVSATGTLGIKYSSFREVRQ
jgi:hypothetical protein